MKRFLLRTLPYITFALIGVAWFSYGIPHAAAKSIPVKDIIKQTEQFSLSEILISEIPAQLTNTSARVYTEVPLFLNPITLTNKRPIQKQTPNDLAGFYSWIQNRVGTTQTEPEDARIIIENERVIDFNPGKPGILPNIRQATLQFVTNPQIKTSALPIPTVTIQPQVPLNEINNLGINEFLSGGISDFSGSSRNRLANIEAGLQQVKGVIIAPGQIFSFGEYLGDVTAEKGFKPEIVIKADGLKPELGGGICQVSSTLFRAVMASGMPITQRKNHAFSVSHYFPVGTDATIYTPVTDLKFINDTPAHVLVWPHYLDKTHLAFDLYGTKDGRQVVVDEPVQWDWKSDGSVKASWSRHVTSNGTTRDDTLRSIYLPPALFKKEEKFVTTTPTTTFPTPATGPGTTSPATPSAPTHIQ